MTKKDLIDLDECVLQALDLFIRERPQSLPFPKSKRPLIVGSGNAAVTGKILFRNKDAVFADESDYEQKLQTYPIDHAVIISASGGKHAPIIAQNVSQQQIPSLLITCNEKAPARKYVDKVSLSPKHPEPYTYNTSTYLGMILSATQENPKTIKKYLKQLQIPDLKRYSAFYIILPNEFELLREMFITKFDELFGPKVNGRVYTVDQTKHAKTIVPSEKELFIGLGVKNMTWGTHRINYVPSELGYAKLLALGYYLIGSIQKQKPDYFKNNIFSYAKEASNLFGQDIRPIVE